MLYPIQKQGSGQPYKRCGLRRPPCIFGLLLANLNKKKGAGAREGELDPNPAPTPNYPTTTHLLIQEDYLLSRNPPFRQNRHQAIQGFRPILLPNTSSRV